jgi:serine/threonine-protein kinase RsbT
MSKQLCLVIRVDRDVSSAALASVRYSQSIGFGETPSRLIGTTVSELARNIIKYAHSGVRKIVGRRGRGIEIEAVDQGPGIEDVDAAMSDHVSSGGTLGLGLPGVKRMTDEFALESTPGSGTRVTVVKWI